MKRKRTPGVTAAVAVEIEVFGEACGIDGYTTPAEARTIARALRLRPGQRALDLGSGRGWPGVRIAELSGAHVVLSDLPRDGLVSALQRAGTLDVRCSAVVASADALPFRAGMFDAIVHTDVLC